MNNQRGGGLSLGVGGRVGAFMPIPSSNGPAAQPQTVGAAAFGASASPSSPSRRAGVAATLVPNDATGIAVWSGIAGIVLLALIRHSLPE